MLLLVVPKNIFPGYGKHSCRVSLWDNYSTFKWTLNAVSHLMLCSFPAGLSCMWVCKCIHTDWRQSTISSVQEWYYQLRLFHKSWQGVHYKYLKYMQQWRKHGWWAGLKTLISQFYLIFTSNHKNWYFSLYCFQLNKNVNKSAPPIQWITISFVLCCFWYETKFSFQIVKIITKLIWTFNIIVMHQLTGFPI